jgi:hypothetical protein
VHLDPLAGDAAVSLTEIGLQLLARLFADNEVVRLATSSLAGGERSC